MLKKVRRLDYAGDYAFAPPQVDAIINTDEIVEAYPCDARGSGPFVAIKFKDGSKITIVGTPNDLIEP